MVAVDTGGGKTLLERGRFACGAPLASLVVFVNFPLKVLLHIGPFQIRSYPLMLSLGLAAGWALAISEAKRRGLDRSVSEGLIATGMIGGLAGAWLYGAVQRQLDTWLGISGSIGTVAYGGLLGGVGLTLLYARWRKILWWPYADAYTPGVLLAIAIVRVGCFLKWDDYGVHTKSLWGVDGGDGPRYPTQLFMSFGALVLFYLAGSIRRRTLPPGTYFLGFAMAEAVLRFWIEWLRDEPHYLFALTAGQWTAGAIIAISLFALRKRQTKQPVPSHGLDFRPPPP